MKITTENTVSKKITSIYFSEYTFSKFAESKSVQTLTIGIGTDIKNTNARLFRNVCRSIIRNAKIYKIENISVSLEEPLLKKICKEHGEVWLAKTFAENCVLANYEYILHKSKKDEYKLKKVVLEGTLSSVGKKGLLQGETIATYTNICRNIANTPGGHMTPALLADDAKKAVQGTQAKVTVFNKKRIEKERMGALLGVAQGSKHGPRFIVIEYWGAGKDTKQKPIVFVGKGITFDTGGLNLKPGDSMLDMHLDMSGGASVIAAVAGIAKMKLKQNIIGLVPAAENAVSDESMRPGDILTTMSGKTVDVLNTDAEGRLVLADALTYAKRYNPRLVIDVATLTGAALVALGEHASALMTKNDNLRKKLLTLAEESGDYMWPLPLWNEYRHSVKGRFGDIANIPATGNTRAGGAINGGMFLAEFTASYEKNCGWAHIDMSPRMVAHANDQLSKGATGEPTRFLIHVAEKY